MIGLTSPAFLQHAADIFASDQPSAAECAALPLAEACSEQPHVDHRLRELVCDEHKLGKKEADELFEDAPSVGFCDTERVENETFYFNGGLFRRDDVANHRAKRRGRLAALKRKRRAISASRAAAPPEMTRI